jgi:hypothetical protein
MRPVYSDDSFVGKAFQRFGKDKVSRAFSFLEANNAKIGSALALQNRHHSIILQLRLKVTVGRGFLPKDVTLRFPGFFDNPRKARGFNFQEPHVRLRVRKSPPENYGKEDQATVAAFLPWRGSQVLNP